MKMESLSSKMETNYPHRDKTILCATQLRSCLIELGKAVKVGYPAIAIKVIVIASMAYAGAAIEIVDTYESEYGVAISD